MRFYLYPFPQKKKPTMLSLQSLHSSFKDIKYIL